MKSVLFSIFFVFSVNAETLKVVLMDKAPFMYKEHGQYVGFHYEIAQEIGKKMGVPVEVVDLPVMRMIEKIKKRDAEITIITDQADLDSLKTKKAFLMKLETFVFTLKTRYQKHEEKFQGKMARITNSCAALKDTYGIDWVDVESYEQALKMLKAKRVDSVCGSVAFEIISKKESDIRSTRVSEKSLWVHAHPDIEKNRWHAIQKATQALVKSGRIEALARTYSR